MAAIAIGLCCFGVVEAAGSMTRYAAQQPAVIVILAPQPFLVVVQRKGQVHFVTGSAEFRGLMQRLEKRLFMEGRFGFDQLMVHPLQQRIFTLCKRIMNRLFNGVVRVTEIAVHVSNGVANRAGDSSLRSGMIQHIELRVIKRTTEKRHRVVTAGTESRALDGSVPFQADFTSFSDAGEIRRVVEGTEAVRTGGPVVMCPLVAVETILIHVQGFGVDEISSRCFCKRREVVLFAVLRPGNAPLPRITGLPVNHSQCRRRCDSHPDQPRLPPQLRTNEAVHPVEPGADHGARDVRPVDRRSDGRTFQLNHVAKQQESGYEDEQAHREQCVTNHDRSTDPAVASVPHVNDAEDQEGRNDQQSQHDVQQKHALVEIILIGPRGPVLQKRNARQVHAVGSNRSQQRQDDIKHDPQSRTNCLLYNAFGGACCRGHGTC